MTLCQICVERKPKSEVSIARENTLSVKLPDIKLPNFSGDFLKWPQFRDTFVALISNNSALSNINKFHYFRSSLQGEAKALLETLPVTEDNYDICMGVIM